LKRYTYKSTITHLIPLAVSSGVTRGLRQRGQNFAEQGPLATVGEPLANTQKRSQEMIVNPDEVDAYTN